MQELTILPSGDYYVSDPPEAAKLNISIESSDAYLEFIADPNEGTISISTVSTPDDELTFEVDDFEAITNLLIRQARRA